MNKEKEKKHWIKMTTTAWIITLVVSFFALFPVFVVLVILWAMGKVLVKD